MGVDLKLMPLIGETDWVAHDMIGLERDSELFEDIAGLGERPVPMPVKCYEAVGPEGDPCLAWILGRLRDVDALTSEDRRAA